MAPAPRERAVDIYLIGRGILGVRQLTAEAREALQSCRLVFDLSGDAAAIRRVNRNVVDLSDDYWGHSDLNANIYERLTRKVLAEGGRGPTIGLVTDGHPMVFDDVCWAIRRRGKKRGLHVVALPGVSCLDTMVIDLWVDLGNGSQIVEANQLVEWNMTLSPHLATFVFQVGKFGTEIIAAPRSSSRKGRYDALAEHLMRWFPPTHPVTLIVSAGDVRPAARRSVRLAMLDRARAFIDENAPYGLTLFLPPLPSTPDVAFGTRIRDHEHHADIAGRTS